MPGNFYEAIAEQAGKLWGVDPKLINSMISAESSSNPDATSKVGARGLMQLMPGTAEEMGVKDPTNPVQNIMGGTRYLRGLLDRYHGDYTKAVAAYNSGPGNVDKYGGIPPFEETQAYVKRIGELYAKAGGPAMGATHADGPRGQAPSNERPQSNPFPSWLAPVQYLDQMGISKFTPEAIKAARVQLQRISPWQSLSGKTYGF